MIVMVLCGGTRGGTFVGEYVGTFNGPTVALAGARQVLGSSELLIYGAQGRASVANENLHEFIDVSPVIPRVWLRDVSRIIELSDDVQRRISAVIDSQDSAR